jgi:hypothetical protein
VTSLLQQSIRIAVGITWVIALLVLSLTTIWAAAALYFDLPASVAPGVLVAIFYVIAVVALLFSFRFSWVALGIGFALFAGIAFWWCSIKPPKSGNWQPQVAETAWTERDGDKIRFITYGTSAINLDSRPKFDGKREWSISANYRELIFSLTFGVQLLSVIRLLVFNSALTIMSPSRLKREWPRARAIRPFAVFLNSIR